ncbi:hypothetical protein LMH87_004917 [Akanthomyces muscarius]|uniref:Cytochrome P450 n=1 Tax=Akanthomyces muscarius TaxID=2231603 RepID=A0A9W8QJP8_AKAMU|nr:hypothetical protein LMH87_004917 [Akanthomyces muscarius]KAJ4163173.1 hypothetical protein LMH87_004917 [Akanthomyces muscarius]
MHLYGDKYINHMGIWFWLAGTAVIFFTVSRFFGARRLPKGAYVNKAGQRIKQVTCDARLAKFLRSAELSKNGQEIAADDPYLIQSGPYQELVISQPSHIQEFYKNDAKDHTKPQNRNFGVLFGRWAGAAVGMQYGDNWKRIRKHFDPVFSFHSVMQNKQRFDIEVQQLIEGLVENNSYEIDPTTAFKYFTFRALALHLYEDGFDDRVYWRMLELDEMHQNIVRVLSSPTLPDSGLYNWLPTSSGKTLANYLTQWKEFNRITVDHARGGNWKCPVEVIYRAVDTTKELTEKEVTSTLDEILFTNVEVSSKVLSTLFVNLAQQPALQEELRAEIKDRNTKPSEEAKYFAKQDTLLNRVVMESMRVSPAFWFSLPQCTSVDKTIGGYLIPANTPVVIDTRRLNNASYTFGADTDVFDPSRFSKIPSEKLRCGFMKFGAGAASGRCLGKNAADVLFKMMVIGILEKFSLSLPFPALGKEGSSTNIKLTKL